MARIEVLETGGGNPSIFEVVRGPHGSVLLKTDREHFGQARKLAAEMTETPTPLKNGDSGNIYTATKSSPGGQDGTHQ